MKTKATVFKNYALLLVFSLSSLVVFSGSPQLVWYQIYGEATLNQQVSVMAIDNYDNMFVAGFVNFGAYGNIIINRYDGLGNMKWNRMYNNTQTPAANDMPVALFPDNQAGVTVVGYINGQAILTHILRYGGPAGNLLGDVSIGDTTAGSKTFPFAVLYDGASSYYMIGQLNSISKIFKCDNSGHVLWSTALHNNRNNQVGGISFDPYGNIIAGVTDSASAQVMIRRYDRNSGIELPGFNTHISSLPVNDNFIKTLVDQNSNIFLASTASDSSGRTQWKVNKFDTTGTLLWSTICHSVKGHSNIINSFLLDHAGDILVSGPFSDNADTLQYAGVYKISGDTGGVIWSNIDSMFLVNEAKVQVDLYDYVYLGTTKTPSDISPYYSNFSFSQLTADSGLVQWNRSFDNSSSNNGLLTTVNNFGDIFFAANTPTDTGAGWFLGRVGNAAGDQLGTGVKAISIDTGNLNVFPNPFTSATRISFTSRQDEKLCLKVYDVAGRILQQVQVQSVAGLNVLEFESNLTPGIYLIKLEGALQYSVKPVVVY